MKKALFGLVILLLVAVAGLAGGYWYGSQRYGAQNMTLTIELQDAQRRLVTAESVAYLMRARVSLYKAAAQLDQRNFGLANGHLKSAASELAKVDPTAAGIAAEPLESVRADLGAMDLSVAVDLEEQRQKVLGLGKRLDEVMPQ